MPKYEVTLTPQEMHQARAEHHEVAKHYGSYDAETYTRVNVDYGFYVGKCGELAVKRWLEEYDLWYEFEAEGLTDRPDHHDMHICLPGGRKMSIDIKTRAEWIDGQGRTRTPDLLMIPHAQFKRHHHDAYIGCSLREADGEVLVEIHGIASRRTIEKGGTLLMRRCLTIEYFFAHLTQLTPEMFEKRRDVA